MIKKIKGVLNAVTSSVIVSLSLIQIQSLCKDLHGLFCLKFKNILSGEKVWI
jgi:hypothetical protein